MCAVRLVNIKLLPADSHTQYMCSIIIIIMYLERVMIISHSECEARSAHYFAMGIRDSSEIVW